MLLACCSMRGKIQYGELSLVERSGDSEAGTRDSWDFLTNHTHVLLCIANDPDIRLRDVAKLVGITERAAQSIVADLARSDYLVRDRVGRRNQYEVNLSKSLRHSVDANCTVGELLALFKPRRQAPGSGRVANSVS